MRRYEVLLFLHIVGAIVWIGVGLAGHALAVWADRKREWTFASQLQTAFGSIEIPAAVLGPLLLLGTGAGLVLEGPWGFTDTWVLVGLAGYALALGLGVAFQGPGLRRYQAIVREHGPEEPAAIAIGRRLNALMWPELAILTVVLLAMATKPRGTGSLTFWIVTAVILFAGVAAMVSSRPKR